MNLKMYLILSLMWHIRAIARIERPSKRVKDETIKFELRPHHNHHTYPNIFSTIRITTKPMTPEPKMKKTIKFNRLKGFRRKNSDMFPESVEKDNKNVIPDLIEQELRSLSDADSAERLIKGKELPEARSKQFFHSNNNLKLIKAKTEATNIKTSKSKENAVGRNKQLVTIKKAPVNVNVDNTETYKPVSGEIFDKEELLNLERLMIRNTKRNFMYQVEDKLVEKVKRDDSNEQYNSDEKYNFLKVRKTEKPLLNIADSSKKVQSSDLFKKVRLQNEGPERYKTAIEIGKDEDFEKFLVKVVDKIGKELHISTHSTHRKSPTHTKKNMVAESKVTRSFVFLRKTKPIPQPSLKYATKTNTSYKPKRTFAIPKRYKLYNPEIKTRKEIIILENLETSTNGAYNMGIYGDMSDEERHKFAIYRMFRPLKDFVIQPKRTSYSKESKELNYKRRKEYEQETSDYDETEIFILSNGLLVPQFTEDETTFEEYDVTRTTANRGSLSPVTRTLIYILSKGRLIPQFTKGTTFKEYDVTRTTAKRGSLISPSPVTRTQIYILSKGRLVPQFTEDETTFKEYDVTRTTTDSESLVSPVTRTQIYIWSKGPVIPQFTEETTFKEYDVTRTTAKSKSPAPERTLLYILSRGHLIPKLTNDGKTFNYYDIETATENDTDENTLIVFLTKAGLGPPFTEDETTLKYYDVESTTIGSVKKSLIVILTKGDTLQQTGYEPTITYYDIESQNQNLVASVENTLVVILSKPLSTEAKRTLKHFFSTKSKSWRVDEWSRGPTGPSAIYYNYYNDYKDTKHAGKWNRYTDSISTCFRQVFNQEIPSYTSKGHWINVPIRKDFYEENFLDYLRDRVHKYTTWSAYVKANPCFTKLTKFFGTTKILALFASRPTLSQQKQAEEIDKMHDLQIYRKDYVVLLESQPTTPSWHPKDDLFSKKPQKTKITFGRGSPSGYEIATVLYKTTKQSSNVATTTGNIGRQNYEIYIDKSGLRIEKKGNVARCFVCGTTMEYKDRIPDNRCYQVFHGMPLPGSNRAMLKWHCYSKTNETRENVATRKSWNQNFTGGCYRRWLDVGTVYDERGCRQQPPALGRGKDTSYKRSFATKRFAHLERLLKRTKNGCVESPHAIITPFSRTVSLYARYHVCVCNGRWCNLSDGHQSCLPCVLLLVLFNLLRQEIF